MKTKMIGLLCVALGFGLCLQAETVVVGGSAGITNKSIIGEPNQFLGQFVMIVPGSNTVSFGAAFFHANTTNTIDQMSIRDMNGNLVEILGSTTVNDNFGAGTSYFRDILTPSYPTGLHGFLLWGRLSQSFTNGESFSFSCTPSSDWQSAQDDVVGNSLDVSPSTVVSFGTIIAQSAPIPVPQTIELRGIRNGVASFAINGKTGYRYYVSDSLDLTNWSVIGSMMVAPTNRFWFDLPAPAESIHKFYRFTELPPFGYKSYPTFQLISQPELGLFSGPLIRFSVTANQSGPVGIGKLSFWFVVKDINFLEVNLYAFTDQYFQNQIPQGGWLANAEPFPIPSTNTESLVSLYPSASAGGPTVIEIPAGQTYYFELRHHVNPVGPHPTVSTTVVTSEVGGFGSFYYPFGLLDLVVGEFIWTPNTLGTSTFTDTDWLTSFGMPGLWPDGLTQIRSM
jgi:hypothetical protein